ncbi:MAG: PIG-L deacetylase family protein [Candidatus Heimdallarchaeaceae archaeon]
MKYLFIFAHPDDETFSCGGTIAKYAEKGQQVRTLCLTSTAKRKEEYLRATKILGVEKAEIWEYKELQKSRQEIEKRITKYILEFRPNVIITHQAEDYHKDHKITFEMVKEAIEWAAHVTQYENAHLVEKLYVTETTILLQDPQILVDISEQIEKKEQAIREYKSQLKKGGENFYIKFHHYRTKMRGIQANTNHAEAYNQIPIKKCGTFYPITKKEL